MSPEVFAEWLRRQRRRVFRTPSSWWYEASPHVFQAFPFHWSIRPEEGELDELLRSRRGIALRCTTPLEAPEGRVSYHAICHDRGYGLEQLDARARNAVRNGLRRAVVAPVPLDRIAEEGWALEVDTCRRQQRDVPLTREAWRQRHLAAAALPGFEGWGALVDGRLAASLLCVRVGDWCEVLAQQCLTEFLPARINNALTFGFTQSMLRRPEVQAIFYTLQSLDAPPSVDDFKFHMGYVARPVRQRIAFHPWVRRAVGPWAHRLVAGALRRCPRSRVLGKAEGVLRFYLEGKLPPSSQPLPPCLEAEGASGAPAASTHGRGRAPMRFRGPQPPRSAHPGGADHDEPAR